MITMNEETVKQIEEDIERMLKHILLGDDLRDFSDDIDSILAVAGSEKTTGDFVGESIAYWDHCDSSC